MSAQSPVPWVQCRLQRKVVEKKERQNLWQIWYLKVGGDEIILVHKYKYLGYEIQIARDLQSRITLAWAAYRARNLQEHYMKITQKRPL